MNNANYNGRRSFGWSAKGRHDLSGYDPIPFKMPDQLPRPRNPRVVSAYKPLRKMEVLSSNFSNLRGGTGENMDPAARLARERRETEA